jgi:tetratricopeptide (TPR) repeat protein
MDARIRVKDLLYRQAKGVDVPRFQFVYGDSINDYSVPYHLTTEEFNEELGRLMEEDGLYLLNLIDMRDVGRFLGAVVRTCRQTFPHVYVFSTNPRSDVRSTFVVACSKQPRDMDRALALLRGRFPYRGELLPSEEVDALARRAGVVLTDDYAPVENLLVEMLRRDRGEALSRYMQAAVALARSGKLERAIETFRQAGRVAPQDPGVDYNMAVAYREAGRPEEAYRRLNEALLKEPRFAEARSALALMYARAGRLEAAIGHWQQALRDRPTRAEAHNNLGNALAQLGRLDEALGHWEEARRLKPEDPGVCNNLANAHFMAGRVAQSVEFYQEALRLDPGLAEAHFNLGDALAHLGRPQEALTHYRRALALQPGMEQARRRVQAMERPEP